MLPYQNITPIPDTEPDAVPALWNTRYEEIDTNFQDMDERVTGVEEEISAAAGESPSIDARIEQVEANLEGMDPDMQNMIVASIQGALDLAGVVSRDIQKMRSVWIQELSATLYNRGIVRGGVVTKSTSATRNLSISDGVFFAHGRTFSFLGMENTAAVPPNVSGETKTCYVYLWIDGNGDTQMDCTQLGDTVPDGGVELYRLSVPANNTEATDPYLNNVDLSDIRRDEAKWPSVCVSPSFASVPLENQLPDTNYAVHCEIESFEGGREQVGSVFVDERLENGFKLYTDGTADTILVRMTVRRVGIC